MKAFDGYHPTVLLVYFCSVLLVAMFVTNPIIQLSALLGGILFCGMLLGRRALPGNIAFYLSMFVLVAITNPLFSHNGVTPLFFLNGNPVTLEAFVSGAAIGVTVIGVMLWCRSLGEIMTSDKLLWLFGRVLPKFSLILSMALRFIPLFRRQLRRVSRAQRAMGLYSSRGYVDRLRGALSCIGRDTKTGSVIRRVSNAIKIFSIMVTWSLENAIETADSMRARGYGIKGRTSFSLFRFYRSDGAVLACSAALLILSLVGVGMGDCTFYFYPRISPLPHTPLAIVSYIAFAALSLLPFIIEVKEALVWKYCISRI